MAIICQVCGTENPEDTEFCEGCGVELAADVHDAIPEPVAAAVGMAKGEDGTEVEEAKEAEAAPASALSHDAAEEASSQTTETSPDSSAELQEPPAESSEEDEAAETAETAEITEIDEAAETSATGEAASHSGAEPYPDGEILQAAQLYVKRYGAVTTDAIPLSAPRLVVGRFDPSTGPVDIDVSGMTGAEHISRRHAEIFFEQGCWHVRDLGSTNGVFIKVAGASSYSPRLQEPSTLNDGDEIAFGNVVFVFREES